MISLISTILNAILNFIIYVLKAVFSMLTWFLKGISKILRLFYCALPLTTIVFVLLFLANLYLVFIGVPDLDLINKYNDVLTKDAQISAGLIRDLKIWWTLNIYPYRGGPVFFLLLILSAIMVIPVGTVLLSVGTVLSFGQILFFAVAADIVIYLLRAILQKSFVSQFMDRFYKLFPERGKRHYEKNYEKWLRKHHNKFEDDEQSYTDCDRTNDFCEDEDDEFDDYEDDEYRDDDFYEDDDEDDDDDFYEDDEEYDDDNFYEDHEEYDDDDFYEDDEEYENAPASAFNFFAGCSSKDSVEKKYKSLVKLYHPDNMDGDTKAIQEINVQYSEAKKRFVE